MLTMGEIVATFFILPRAWIHHLLQLEHFLSVRDFQLSTQSCNKQFSGIAHFIVISTFMTRQYRLVSHVACDWCVWGLAINISQKPENISQTSSGKVKCARSTKQLWERCSDTLQSTTTSNLSTSQHEAACSTYARTGYIQPIFAKTKCPLVTCRN
jgi:hypothetical protein